MARPHDEARRTAARRPLIERSAGCRVSSRQARHPRKTFRRVPQAKKQDGIGDLFLDTQVLRYQGSVFNCHYVAFRIASSNRRAKPRLSPDAERPLAAAKGTLNFNRVWARRAERVAR